MKEWKRPTVKSISSRELSSVIQASARSMCWTGKAR